MKIVNLLFLFVLLGLAFGDQFGPFRYEIAENGNVAIVGYEFDGFDHVPIPDYIDGRQVDRIRAYAFSNINEDIAVVLPKNRLVIESRAFDNCSGLRVIIIRDALPEVESDSFYNPHESFLLSRLSTAQEFPQSGPLQNYDRRVIDVTIYPAAEWLLRHGMHFRTSLTDSENRYGKPLLPQYSFNKSPMESTAPVMFEQEGLMRVGYYGEREYIKYTVETSLDLNAWSSEGIMTEVASIPGISRMAYRQADRGKARFYRVNFEAISLPFENFLVSMRRGFSGSILRSFTKTSNTFFNKIETSSQTGPDGADLVTISNGSGKGIYFPLSNEVEVGQIGIVYFRWLRESGGNHNLSIGLSYEQDPSAGISYDYLNLTGRAHIDSRTRVFQSKGNLDAFNSGIWRKSVKSFFSDQWYNCWLVYENGGNEKNNYSLYVSSENSELNPELVLVGTYRPDQSESLKSLLIVAGGGGSNTGTQFISGLRIMRLR
jgi:hypothetical protein